VGHRTHLLADAGELLRLYVLTLRHKCLRQKGCDCRAHSSLAHSFEHVITGAKLANSPLDVSGQHLDRCRHQRVPPGSEITETEIVVKRASTKIASAGFVETPLHRIEAGERALNRGLDRRVVGRTCTKLSTSLDCFSDGRRSVGKR